MHKYSCGRSVRATDLKTPFTKGSQQSALDSSDARALWSRSHILYRYMMTCSRTNYIIHLEKEVPTLYNGELCNTGRFCGSFEDPVGGSNFQKWTSAAWFEIITLSNGEHISIRCWFWSLTVFGRPDPSTEKKKQVRLESLIYSALIIWIMFHFT